MDKEEDISSTMHSYAKKALQVKESEMEVTLAEQQWRIYEVARGGSCHPNKKTCHPNLAMQKKYIITI